MIKILLMITLIIGLPFTVWNIIDDILDRRLFEQERFKEATEEFYMKDNIRKLTELRDKLL